VAGELQHEVGDWLAGVMPLDVVGCLVLSAVSSGYGCWIFPWTGPCLCWRWAGLRGLGTICTTCFPQYLAYDGTRCS
jgi:hypothetical protein